MKHAMESGAEPIRRAVLAALAVAAFATGCRGGEHTEAAGDAARAPGPTESAPAESAPASYRPLPALEVTHLDGRPADLDQFRGRVVVLNLWATWCIPCRDEMPELQQMHARYAADPLDVVGISIDEGDVALVEGFLEEFDITYPNFLGDGSGLTQALDLYPGVPHTLLVDAEGLIRGYWGGRFHPFEPETAALVERVLSEAR